MRNRATRPVVVKEVIERERTIARHIQEEKEMEPVKNVCFLVCVCLNREPKREREIDRD